MRFGSINRLWPKALEVIRIAQNLLVESYRSWAAHNAMQLAAAFAYYTLFSIAPLTLVAISLVGVVFGEEAAAGQVYGQLEGTMGSTVASSIEGLIASAQKPVTSVLGAMIAFGMVLFGASGMLEELKDALNTIWGGRDDVPSGFLSWMRGRILSIGMVVGVCLLLLVSLLLSAGLHALSQSGLNGHPAATGVLRLLHVSLSFAFISVLFAMTFRYVPHRFVPWEAVWVGGVGTAALFTLGKMGLEVYLAKAAVVSSYGAAGGVAAVLVWVYYSSQIFFFGAEFTQVYARRHQRPNDPSGASGNDTPATPVRLPVDQRTPSEPR